MVEISIIRRPCKVKSALRDDLTPATKRGSSGGGYRVNIRRVKRRKRSSLMGLSLAIATFSAIISFATIIQIVHGFTSLTIQTHNHYHVSSLQSTVNSDVSELEVPSSASSSHSSDTLSSKRPPCFWKPKGEGSSAGIAAINSKQPETRRRDRGPKWRPRVHLDDLKVGDRLDGSHVVQEFLDGKTGPKIFVECGVGRTSPKRKKKKTGRIENDGDGKSVSTSSNNNKNNDDNDDNDDYEESWSIVYGMVRLGHKGMKASVVRKRSAKLRSRDSFPVWVTRIRPECAWLEVCTREDDLEPYLKEAKQPRKIPVTSLQPQQEVKGEVVKIFPYGVLVDVGANCPGLLHVRKIASLYNKFIDKEQGIIDAGLPRGTRVRLQVESIESRRLFLDFTDDVKDEAKAETQRIKEEKKLRKKQRKQQLREQNQQQEMAVMQALNQGPVIDSPQNANVVVSDDNVPSEIDDTDGEDEDDDDEDEYDEDEAIEDAFGLDMY